MYLLVLPGQHSTEFGLTPVRVCKVLTDDEARAFEAQRRSAPELVAFDPARSGELGVFSELLQAVRELVDEPARPFAYAMIDHVMDQAAQREVRTRLYASLLAPYFRPGCAIVGLSWQMCRWQSEMALHFTPSMLVLPVARTLGCSGWLQLNRVGVTPADLRLAIQCLKHEIRHAPDDPQVLAELRKRLAHHEMVLQIKSKSWSADDLLHAKIFMDLSAIVPAAEHPAFIEDFRHLVSTLFMGEWLCLMSQRIVGDNPRAMISVVGGFGLPAALSALARRPTVAADALRDLDTALRRANAVAREAWRSACQAARDMVMKGGRMGCGFTALARLAIAKEKAFAPPCNRSWVREADSLRFKAGECAWLTRWTRTQHPEQRASLVGEWARWIEGDADEQGGVPVPRADGSSRKRRRATQDAEPLQSIDARPDAPAEADLPSPPVPSGDAQAERRLQIEVMQGAAAYLSGEIEDLAGQLHLLDSAQAQQQAHQAWLARLFRLTTELGTDEPDASDAFELLTEAQAWVTQVQDSLQRCASASKDQEAFRKALLHALERERFIFEGHRAGGAVGMPVQPSDWAGIHACCHDRRVLGLGLRFGEVEMDLPPDEALVLYVTASSQSGYLFDVSLHLWRCRSSQRSGVSAEALLASEALTRTSARDAPPQPASGPGRAGGRGRAGRQPRGRGAMPSVGPACRLAIEAEPMDRGHWYDTRSTVLVLHVPRQTAPSQGRGRRARQGRA